MNNKISAASALSGMQTTATTENETRTITLEIGDYRCRILIPCKCREYHSFDFVDYSLIKPLPVRAYKYEDDVWTIGELPEDVKSFPIFSTLDYFRRNQSNPKLKELGNFTGIQIYDMSNEYYYQEAVSNILDILTQEILTLGNTVTSWLTGFVEDLKDALILYDEERLVIITSRFAWDVPDYTKADEDNLRKVLRKNLPRYFSGIELYGCVERDYSYIEVMLREYTGIPVIVEKVAIDEIETIDTENHTLIRYNSASLEVSCKALGFEIYKNNFGVRARVNCKKCSPIRFTAIEHSGEILETRLFNITGDRRDTGVVVYTDTPHSIYPPAFDQVKSVVNVIKGLGLDYISYSYVVSLDEATVVQSPDGRYSLVIYHNNLLNYPDIERAVRAFKMVTDCEYDKNEHKSNVMTFDTYLKASPFTADLLTDYLYAGASEPCMIYTYSSGKSQKFDLQAFAVSTTLVENDYFSGIADLVLRFMRKTVHVKRYKDLYLITYGRLVFNEEYEEFSYSNYDSEEIEVTSLRALAEHLVDKALNSILLDI